MVSFYKYLLCILFFVLINTLTSFAEPLLNVEQVIEEKSVLTGEAIKGKLVLKNKGDELLKILGVSSTCECTTLKLKERRIQPGDEVDLNFVVDTRGSLVWLKKQSLYTPMILSKFSDNVSFTLITATSAGNYSRTVYVWFKDKGGNVSSSASDKR